MVNKMSNINKHAEREFNAAGWTNPDGTFKDEMQGLMCKQVLELLDLFSSHNHSGTTAPYALNMFKTLASFKPLVPLTGKDDEWVTHQDERTDGVMLRQNKRCSSVFQQSDRFDGQAYNIDGKVFWNWCERDLDKDEEGYPGVAVFKSFYTNSDSFVTIKFPYTIPDKPEYVYVQPEDNNDFPPQNEYGVL